MQEPAESALPALELLSSVGEEGSWNRFSEETERLQHHPEEQVRPRGEAAALRLAQPGTLLCTRGNSWQATANRVTLWCWAGDWAQEGDLWHWMWQPSL